MTRTTPLPTNADGQQSSPSRGVARMLVPGLVALPFILFVVLSTALWTGWAVNGREPLLVAFAVGPLAVAGITFAISAARGNAPSRRLAPMLVAACGMTALLWGVVVVIVIT